MEEVWINVRDKDSIRSELLGDRSCYFALKKLAKAACTLEQIEECLLDLPPPHVMDILDTIDFLVGTGAAMRKYPLVLISDAGKRWHTHLRAINTDSWERYIEVVYGYMTVPVRFLEEVKIRRTLLDKITVVSPWVTNESFVLSLTAQLENYDSPQIRVLRTRPRSDRRPEQHQKCIGMLSKAGFDVKFLHDLHAKVYLGLSYRNPPDSFAMISSANLTEDSVFDVAVLLFGVTDDFLDTIFSLDSIFAYS